jgi:hypothetical protein
MGEPNLFDEAPSELSQDAFFCWIFKWLNHDDLDHPMRKVSWNLLQRILEKIGAKVDWQQFRSLQIKRQFHSVDFVAVVELKSSPSLVLVVEDKVDALLTGHDQLERNIQKLVANQREWEPLRAVSRDRIHGVLLKTGYDFDFRPPDGYVKINRDNLTRWIDGIASGELVRNNILRDWVEHFRRERQQSRSFVDDAGQMDNTDPNSSWWSNPENQYKLFKELFCVTEEQIVLHRHRDNGENIWFNRQGEPLTREYFRRMTPKGNRSMFYNFKFPAGYWDADLANRPFEGTCSTYYYRLLFVAGIWGIALRFWKADKSAAEKTKMYQLAEIFTRILRDHHIVTHSFKRYDDAAESTILLIDPARSPGIGSLYDAHGKFVLEADQHGPW